MPQPPVAAIAVLYPCSFAVARLSRLLARLPVGVSAVALLSACGGGDDDSALASKALIPLTPAAAFLAEGFVDSFAEFVDEVAALRQTEAYWRQDTIWRFPSDPAGQNRTTSPLASARIDYAHAAGLTGAGVTVAVMDEGFLTTHETMAGKTLTAASTLPVASHGTAVASVLAGQAEGFIGVAPGAALVLGSYDTSATRLALTRRAIDDGAIAINNSWGFQDTPVSEGSFDAVFAGTTGQAWYDALAGFAQSGVVVFAASNSGTDRTSGIMEALPHLRPELAQGWLAVVNGDATWTEATITSAVRLSAPCAEAAPWCLAAEGTWEAANASGTGGYGLVTGTSFAAPMVTGALALLAEAFPTHTPHQLRIRLLASADNVFTGFTKAGSVELAEGVFHDYSREWGHGFLDVRAALLPIGTVAARMADGSLIDVTEPVAVTGGAVGDAVRRSLAGVQMIATDALGGDFHVAPDVVLARAAVPDAGDRLAAVTARDFGATGLAFGAYDGPQFRLRSGDLEVAALAPALTGAAPGGRRAMGLTVGRRIETEGGTFSLGLGVTQDDGRLLPSGLDGAAPVMYGITMGYSADAGDAFLSVGGAVAFAKADAMGPVGAAALTMTAIDLTAGARDVIRRGDSLRLGVSLPMTVVSGQAHASLPTARSAGGLVYDSVAVDFAPERREVNLSLVYDMATGAGSSAFVGAMQSFNHGNVAGARDSAATVGWRVRF